mmetsp:Transcript_23110/g.63805  ORF Transcript_23110/g.63805 Transcript_23110/m.63805 type:complete len:395 (+) Transcript_23110:707-1891(+)
MSHRLNMRSTLMMFCLLASFMRPEGPTKPSRRRSISLRFLKPPASLRAPPAWTLRPPAALPSCDCAPAPPSCVCWLAADVAVVVACCAALASAEVAGRRDEGCCCCCCCCGRGVAAEAPLGVVSSDWVVVRVTTRLRRWGAGFAAARASAFGDVSGGDSSLVAAVGDAALPASSCSCFAFICLKAAFSGPRGAAPGCSSSSFSSFSSFSPFSSFSSFSPSLSSALTSASAAFLPRALRAFLAPPRPLRAPFLPPLPPPAVVAGGEATAGASSATSSLTSSFTTGCDVSPAPALLSAATAATASSSCAWYCATVQGTPRARHSFSSLANTAGSLLRSVEALTRPSKSARAAQSMSESVSMTGSKSLVTSSGSTSIDSSYESWVPPTNLRHVLDWQ